MDLRVPEHDPDRIFPVICEMKDAGLQKTKTCSAPSAAAVEIARLLVRFDGQIDDDARHLLITLGGALLNLQGELDESRKARG